MGSAAPASSENAPEPQLVSRPEPQREPQASPHSPLQVQARPSPAETTSSAAPLEKLRSAVLQALTDGNQRILVSMLEAGEWAVEGNEVVVRVSESQTVVDMSLGADARRLAIASASGILGRAIKLRIVSGANVTAAEGKGNGTATIQRNALVCRRPRPRRAGRRGPPLAGKVWS